MKRGKFIVIDGLDGIGKGVFLRALQEEAEKSGKKVFDIEKYWQENNEHPSVNEIIGKYDAVITAEPTFVEIGKYIREELIARNGRNYSPQTIAEAYALDRRILYERLLLPLLENGIDTYQSRSLSTSIVYQRQSALDEGKEFSINDILKIPGNTFCHQYPMDFLIVPTLPDIQEVMRRLESRKKDDNCIFEVSDFQLKVKEHYDSLEFREIFESNGTQVIYMDAGKTVEFSKQQMRDFYQQHLL